MPDKSGYDVFEEIKSLGKSEKAFFVILSGVDSESEINLAHDKGIHAYYTKPIRKPELSELLKKAKKFKNNLKK